MYGEGHPYSAPLTGTGTEAATAQLTVSELQDFHQTWFKPNNATLIVVGDTTAEEILPRIRAAFAGWNRGSLPAREVPTVPLRAGTSVYLLDKPGAEQSVIFAAHLAPPKANRDERGIEILNALLGGKFTSRLNLNLRENKHWTYGARTELLDARHQRLFFAVAPVQTDKTADAIREIRQELTAVIGPRPPEATEVAETVKQTALELAGRWETRDAVAGSLAELVRFDFPDNYFATYATSVQTQTVDTVTRAARVLVQPDRLVWVVVGDRAKIETGLRELGYGPVELLDADGAPGARVVSERLRVQSGGEWSSR
ncbi:MAG: insulinase family protein [Verrucomicrobia bacterium]|nr:insulinase family protein [Verrucomicrobiota bacterium]